jgi:glycosyltransferase involved in cell wall biosynthesis
MIIKSASALVKRQSWLVRHRREFRTQSRSGAPRLFVDVSEIIRHDAGTGIQRVVRAIWSQLAQRDGRGFELVPVYATEAHGYCRAPADFLLGSRESRRAPIQVNSGDKFLGLDLAAHLLPKYASQVRSWREEGASLHVVVYDLLPLLRPEWFTSAAVRHFRRWVLLLAREADQAICISNAVAQELRRQLNGLPPERPQVTSIPLGCDIAASLPSAGMRADVAQVVADMRARPTILMVGTIEPRKGYDAALAAFEYLWQTRREDAPDFVIVGKAGWKTAALQTQIRQHPEYGRRFRWLTGVSDEGLCRLYESCSAFLITSHGEGFGLPLLEAAKHGCPTLARDLPVFREQCLPNVSYFSADDPQALGEAIAGLPAGQPARSAPLDLPTWSDCVNRLLAILGFDDAASPKLAQRAAAAG